MYCSCSADWAKIGFLAHQQSIVTIRDDLFLEQNTVHIISSERFFTVASSHWTVVIMHSHVVLVLTPVNATLTLPST